MNIACFFFSFFTEAVNIFYGNNIINSSSFELYLYTAVRDLDQFLIISNFMEGSTTLYTPFSNGYIF